MSPITTDPHRSLQLRERIGGTLPFLLAVTAALVATLPRLGLRAFWVDESIAALPAASIHERWLPYSPFDLDFLPWQIKDGIWDPATPLYRYLLALFTWPLGFSTTTARLFSVLMAFATLVPFYLLVRRAYDRLTAQLAVVCCAWSPTFMLFAREARHFTTVMCLAALTLWQLDRARRGVGGRAWGPLVLATLATHPMGYLLLPVVGALLLLLPDGERRAALARLRTPYFTIALLGWLALFAWGWETLPFFHEVSCRNHPAGCHPGASFYLLNLYQFLAPRFPFYFPPPRYELALVPWLALIGLVLAWRSARSDTERWLFLFWWALPVALLATREVKFPRYVYMWSFPILSLYLAVVWRRFWRRRWLGLLAGVVLLAAPRWSPAEGLRSGTWELLRNEVWTAHPRDIGYVRASVAYLRDRLRPEDIVVTSFDDASIGFHLGRFVHGFLNSRRSDADFLALLDEARRRGARLWFVDLLMRNRDFCLTPDPEPVWISCWIKYERFLDRCSVFSEAYDPTCRHLIPAGEERHEYLVDELDVKRVLEQRFARPSTAEAVR